MSPINSTGLWSMPYTALGTIPPSPSPLEEIGGSRTWVGLTLSFPLPFQFFGWFPFSGCMAFKAVLFVDIGQMKTFVIRHERSHSYWRRIESYPVYTCCVQVCCLCACVCFLPHGRTLWIRGGRIETVLRECQFGLICHSTTASFPIVLLTTVLPGTGVHMLGVGTGEEGSGCVAAFSRRQQKPFKA